MEKVPEAWRHLAPGIVVLRRLLGDVEENMECVTRIGARLRPECSLELLEGEPRGCQLSYGDGVLLYLETCRGKKGAELPQRLPEETRRHLERVLEAAKRSRLRPVRIVADAELAHVVLHAGCGTVTVTVAPDGTVAVTSGEGADAEYLGGRFLVVCRGKPPYLELDEYRSIGGEGL